LAQIVVFSSIRYHIPTKMIVDSFVNQIRSSNRFKYGENGWENSNVKISLWISTSHFLRAKQVYSKNRTWIIDLVVIQ
jgi:hypothetical protein